MCISALLPPHWRHFGPVALRRGIFFLRVKISQITALAGLLAGLLRRLFGLWRRLGGDRRQAAAGWPYGPLNRLPAAERQAQRHFERRHKNKQETEYVRLCKCLYGRLVEAAATRLTGPYWPPHQHEMLPKPPKSALKRGAYPEHQMKNHTYYLKYQFC